MQMSSPTEETGSLHQQVEIPYDPQVEIPYDPLERPEQSHHPNGGSFSTLGWLSILAAATGGAFMAGSRASQEGSAINGSLEAARGAQPRGGGRTVMSATTAATEESPNETKEGAQKEPICGVIPNERCNVPPTVLAKVGTDLILKADHPLGIIWKTTQEYFAAQDPTCKFYDRESQVVTTKQCFDDLLVKPDHPSRSPSDTYYVNDSMILRTHTSAHQCEHMALYPEVKSFLCAGDVFRRDEIDASHYPVFHQCEGVRLFDAKTVSVDEVRDDLKKTLEGLAEHLFQLKTGEDTMRWNDDYFPFTDPSFELEIFYNDDWLEVLGCGVIHHDVLRNAGLDPSEVHGWAFGLGLERLAMVLFGIPDIRLFWSTDERFLDQFDKGAFEKKTQFQPFSKYPPCLKDVSMWIPDGFADNDLFEIFRDEGGDQIESVELLDEFTNPKTGKSSKMFRTTWRDLSRSLTNEEINAKQEAVRERLVKELKVELR
jgi:phenylalanyl-tRNA synthetase alpha chain